MEELLNRVNELISSASSSVSYYTNEIDVNNQKLDRYKEWRDNLDTIFIEELSSRVTPELRNSKEFKDALDYVGFFEKYSSESQIRKAKNYLGEIVEDLASKQEKKCNDLLDKYRYWVGLLNSSKVAGEFLNGYTPDTFVDENTLESVYTIIKEQMPTKEGLNILLTIAKNNNKISLMKAEPKVEEPKVEEPSEEVESLELEDEEETLSLGDIEKGRIEVNSITPADINEYRNQFISMYNNFVNSARYKDTLGDLYNKTLLVTNGIDEEIRNMSDEDLELQLAFIEEGIVDNRVNASILLLKSILTGNIEHAKEILDSYVNNCEMSNNEYFALTGRIDYEMDYNKAKELVGNNFETTKAYKYLEGAPKFGSNHDKMAYLRSVNVSKEDSERYDIQKLLEDIDLILSVRPITEESKKALPLYFEKLEIMNNILEFDLSVLDAAKTPSENELYNGYFNNYVVLLDKDLFMEEAKELIREKSDVKYKNIADKIKRLTLLSQVELQNDQYARNIHVNGGDNDYELLEFRGGSGNVRVGFKRVEGAEIKGKPVYMVVMPSYIRVGSYIKNDGVAQNIKYFEKNLDKYNEIVKACSKEKNKDEVSPEATKLITECIRAYEELTGEQNTNKAGNKLVGGNNE